MALTEDDKTWISTEISAQLERVETNLLTEFHKWAPNVERTIRISRDRIAAIESDVDSLRDRVTKLEGGQPPVAA
jgi:ubiquinone biosynthesis protein UbiJ